MSETVTSSSPLGAPEGTDAPVIAAVGLTKRYGGTTVLDSVSLTLGPGEVRALLGENGAGKSTLIKILSGVVRSDGGHVEIDGRRVTIQRPADAVAQGIATLHQEVSIVPGLSVAENIGLGHPYPTRWGAVRWRELEAWARRWLATLDQDLDLRADAATLSPVGKTMTAIARALSHQARLLILDEPTAALTDAESQQLFAAMQRLSERGVAILYVSHRLEEVMAICDTYTVLRNGVEVAQGDIATVSVPEIITAMAGRAVATTTASTATVDRTRPVVLATRGLNGRRCRDIDLEVREGEILGIAGLAGSGRSELLRMLAGAQRRRGGTVTLSGASFDPSGVGEAQRAGVVLVPQERRQEGIVPDSVERNANLTTVSRHTRAGVVHRSRARGHAQGIVQRMQVRHRHLDQPILTLSGGNQQKVVIGKFLALDPTVLLLDEPSRGVDVATKAEIAELVRHRAAAGMAAVVVSSELAELLAWCDRIVVMHEGRITADVATAGMTEDRLLHACYGRT